MDLPTQRRWCIGTVACLVAFAEPALAQTPAEAPLPRTMRLDYVGPGRCPDATHFHDRVILRRPRYEDPFTADAPTRLVVTLWRATWGYRGQWDVIDATGVVVRHHELGPVMNCLDLVDGLAFGFVLRFDDPDDPPPSEATDATPEPADAVPSKGPVVWAPPPLPHEHFPPVSPRAPSFTLWDAIGRMDLTIGLSAYGLMTVGLTANVGPGFGIGVDVRGEVFSLGVEVRGVLPAVAYAADPYDPTSNVTPRPGAFDLSQWTGLLVPCGRYKYFVGCAVAQAGGFVLHGDLDDVFRWAVAFGPRVGLEVPLGERFAVFGFGEALFTPAVAGIYETERNVEWKQSIVSGFFGAGLSVNFK